MICLADIIRSMHEDVSFEVMNGPACSGICEDWSVRNGNIFGPQSNNPEGMTNEVWTNKCMDKFYKHLSFRSMKTNSYYRFVSDKCEFNEAITGKFRTSKNHFKLTEEKGKSVSVGPYYQYWRQKSFGFLLTGNIMGATCSDGAPLLEVNENLMLASDLMTVSELLTRFYEINQDIFQRWERVSGVSESDLFLVSLGVWDNYNPSIRK